MAIERSRRWRLRVIGLATALAAPGLLALPARAADPATDMWQASRTTWENFTQHLRALPQHRMQDIMQIRPEGKLLVLRSPLNGVPAEQQMRVAIDGMHGVGMISINRGDHPEGNTEPLAFSLSFSEFPAPRQMVNVTVSVSPPARALQLSKTVQTSGGPMYQVIFTQQKAQTSGGSAFVQLIIVQTRAAGAAPDQINLEGADFFSFIREHPIEAEQHLRPLFREFGQEAVFAPDPMTAWQVFSDLWQPNPIVAKQVQALLPGLNADDYHTRNAAQIRLQQLGREGAAVLIHLDRSRLTPEQNARIDRALIPFAQLPAREAARLRSDPGFLLDCLYSDNLALREAAVNQLRRTIRPDLPFDVNAPAAARAAAVQTLRTQLIPARAAAMP
jgi:hypothetical protein